MKQLKNSLALLIVLIAFAACKQENTKSDAATNAVEKAEKALNDVNAKLANFEYVCGHCQIGAHEPGKCACGMEMKENANFVAPAEEKPETDTEEDTEEAEEQSL